MADKERILKELASKWLGKQREIIKDIHMDDTQCKHLIRNVTLYLASVELSARKEEKLARNKRKKEKDLLGGEELIRQFNAIALTKTDPNELGVGAKAFADVIAYIHTLNIRGAELVAYCATLLKDKDKVSFDLDNAQHISSITEKLCEAMHNTYGIITAMELVKSVCIALPMSVVSDPQKRQENAEDVIMEVVRILKSESLVMESMDIQVRKGFLLFLAGCADWSIVKEYETEDPEGYKEWLNDPEVAREDVAAAVVKYAYLDNVELERLLFKTIHAKIIVYILTKLPPVKIREWCSRLDIAHGAGNKPNTSAPSEQILTRLGLDYQVWDNASSNYAKQVGAV
jgi:hypothetical protein